jgi:hypothetical protein
MVAHAGRIDGLAHRQRVFEQVRSQFRISSSRSSFVAQFVQNGHDAREQHLAVGGPVQRRAVGEDGFFAVRGGVGFDRFQNISRAVRRDGVQGDDEVAVLKQVVPVLIRSHRGHLLLQRAQFRGREQVYGLGQARGP